MLPSYASSLLCHPKSIPVSWRLQRSRKLASRAYFIDGYDWILSFLLVFILCVPAPVDAERGSGAVSKQAELDFLKGQEWYWGKEGTRDYKEAHAWFVKAAMNGHPRALAMVADMCVTGLGTSLNKKKGFHYARRAAKQQDVFGSYLLGKYYFWGWGTDRNIKHGEEIFSQILPHLEDAAEQGDPLAQFGLGWVYYHLSDKVKDYQKAFEWYQKSAGSGYVVAENNLGVLYGNGHGVRGNVQQGIVWYQKAAEQGYAKSQLNLAYALGNTGDFAGQFRWTQVAAAQQNPHGLYRLGYLYEHGEGVKQNFKRASFWYLKAAKQGSRVAGFQLGNLYYRGHGVARDYMQAMKWFRFSAEKGHAQSMSLMGQIYEKGLGIPIDYREARKWYLKGAEAGNYYSQEHIGHLLINGLGGEVDYDDANLWLRQAAIGGRKGAYYGIGLIHEYRGQYSKAIRWYLLSAVKGFGYGFRRAVYLLVMYPIVSLGLERPSPSLT